MQRFPQNVQGPGRLRLPISRANDVAQLLQDGPDELAAVILDEAGEQVGDPIVAGRRDVAPGPYYDFRVELDTVGVYYLVADGGPPDGAAFQVVDPATIAVPGPGDVLPGFDTPTVGDPRGVNPICTREPEPCGLHSITLAEALSTGQPVAYYVGTPAFCATGSCGPALDALLEVQPEFPEFVFVHAEVYADPAGTEVAPAVQAVGKSYEPALFVTDRSGAVVERLDAVWNTAELRDVLASVG